MVMTQRHAGMLRRQADEWEEREMPVQAECCRQAARHMEERQAQVDAVQSPWQPMKTAPKDGWGALAARQGRPARYRGHRRLIQTGYGERPGQSPRVPGLDKPLGTAVAGQKHALVTAFLAKHYTGVVGSDLADPIGTDPMHTIPTKDRLGLVMVHSEPWAIVDIGLRMLTPRELYRAQGFPENYIIDKAADGTPLTKTAQVRMCGNSVCPPIARALVAANYAEQAAGGERRAA